MTTLPTDTALSIIAVFLAACFVGICLLIYWTHQRNKTLELFDKRLEELVEAKEEIEEKEK